MNSKEAASEVVPIEKPRKTEALPDEDDVLTKLGSLKIAPKKKLLVLDLNGLLIYRVFKDRSAELKSFDEHKGTAASVGSFWVWKR